MNVNCGRAPPMRGGYSRLRVGNRITSRMESSMSGATRSATRFGRLASGAAPARRPKLVPYPTHPRAPWTNGRVERDHQEILNWLIVFEVKEVTREMLEREIDGGRWRLKYI